MTHMLPWQTGSSPSLSQVVRIVGNARTKAGLIGQRAIVRRAVGLGGWHWLVRALRSREPIRKYCSGAVAIEAAP